MTSFTTQTEARRFFVDKIVEQAAIDGVPLSDDERRMLSWSESEPDSVSDPGLAERLSAEISDRDYERKIADLLKSCFNREAAGDPRATQVWRDAWAVLRRGDHYILVMIDEALGRHLKPWWQFW